MNTAAQRDDRWKLPTPPGIAGAVISGPARLVEEFVSQVARVLTLVLGRFTGQEGAPEPSRATAPDPRKSARAVEPAAHQAAQVVRETVGVAAKAAPARVAAPPAPRAAEPAPETVAPAPRKAAPVQEKPAPVEQKVAPVQEQLTPVEEKPAPAPRKAQPVAKKAPAAAAPRRAPVRKALPIKGYESLSAAAAVAAIRALTEADEVEAVAKHERENKPRVTVITAAETRARGLSAPETA